MITVTIYIFSSHQKKSKHKAPIPVPRKSKTSHESAGQTEPIEFSHCTPQHAFNVRLVFVEHTT